MSPGNDGTAHRGVVDALHAHGRRVNGSGAQCPAHDDRNASLSITQADDRVLLKCQAGCTTEDVVAALGLKMADLYNEPLTSGTKPAVVKTYRYVDEQGTVLYEKQRLVPKGFRQRAADGTWSLNGTRRVLYNLPAVLEAIERQDFIYLVEGEKDADTLTRLGVAATTWTEGAWKPGSGPKWRDDYTQTLAGARVVIVRDRDDAGRCTAADIERAIGPVAQSVMVLEPAVGKDVTEHIEAGRPLTQLQPAAPQDDEVDDDNGSATSTDETAHRRVVLTRADTIKPRPVRWLWAGRLALGTLGLLAGREGLGKSMLGYWLVAQITQGALEGQHAGTPKSVLICATEDSWEHTIVPRLIAAGADRTRVYRVEVISADDITVGLSLPRDMDGVGRSAREVDAALLLLDPLLSRLDGNLDTHKDSEVRRALEPLVALADDVGMTVLGLIHHNKSGTADPLQAIMASRAFTAVARSVHTVVADPDDETERRRLFGSPKNNLASDSQPTLAFTIEPTPVDTDEGVAWTGRLEWVGEVVGTIREAMRSASSSDDERGATREASDWLEDYLTARGGRRAVLDVYELEEHEMVLLRQAVRTVDACATLQAMVDEDGVMVDGRAHPAMVELRQQRIILARLIVALRVPMGEVEGRTQYRGMRGVYGIRGAVR